MNNDIVKLSKEKGDLEFINISNSLAVAKISLQGGHVVWWKPKSIKEILGISGRIVKAGKDTIVAGNLSYGGSKHVATALLTVSKKYPKIHSAINLKYKKEKISKIKKLKLATYDYNRSEEPQGVKIKGSTIAWGIKTAIKNSRKMPDVIYHKGDFGKEPMILVFAETPDIIIKKIMKII